MFSSNILSQANATEKSPWEFTGRFYTAEQVASVLQFAPADDEFRKSLPPDQQWDGEIGYAIAQAPNGAIQRYKVSWKVTLQDVATNNFQLAEQISTTTGIARWYVTRKGLATKTAGLITPGSALASAKTPALETAKAK